MLNKKELKLVTKAILSSSLFILFLNLLTLGVSDSQMHSLKRFFILFGGDFFAGGYIHWLLYFAFSWSILDLLKLKRKIVAESSYFKAKLLPENEKHFLIANDVNEIYQKVISLKKSIRKLY